MRSSTRFNVLIKMKSVYARGNNDLSIRKVIANIIFDKHFLTHHTSKF